jgi:hypothetical protein
MCNSWCGPLCGLRCPETPTSVQFKCTKRRQVSGQRGRTRATFEPEDTWVRVQYETGQNMPSLEIEFNLDTNCNPCRSPILVREVQPPLIYLRGDGQLNNTQSQKPIYKPLFFLSRPCFQLIVRRCSSCWRASICEVLGAGEPT